MTIDIYQATPEEEKITHLLFVSETEEELLRELEGESDALNPNCQPQPDVKPLISREVAFIALVNVIDEINDQDLRIKLRNKLIDYINSRD